MREAHLSITRCIIQARQRRLVQSPRGCPRLLVKDERGEPAVYPLVEPASHYYQVMTKSEWMPVLIGERVLRREGEGV